MDVELPGLVKNRVWKQVPRPTEKLVVGVEVLIKRQKSNKEEQQGRRGNQIVQIRGQRVLAGAWSTLQAEARAHGVRSQPQ